MIVRNLEDYRFVSTLNSSSESNIFPANNYVIWVREKGNRYRSTNLTRKFNRPLVYKVISSIYRSFHSTYHFTLTQQNITNLCIPMGLYLFWPPWAGASFVLVPLLHNSRNHYLTVEYTGDTYHALDLRHCFFFCHQDLFLIKTRLLSF